MFQNCIKFLISRLYLQVTSAQSSVWHQPSGSMEVVTSTTPFSGRTSHQTVGNHLPNSPRLLKSNFIYGSICMPSKFVCDLVFLDYPACLSTIKKTLLPPSKRGSPFFLKLLLLLLFTLVYFFFLKHFYF